MQTTSQSLIRRAYDTYKRRKVKCDNEHPCANCRITLLQCTYTVPQKRRGPRRQTVTVTPTSTSASPPEQQQTLHNANNENVQGLLNVDDVQVDHETVGTSWPSHSTQDGVGLLRALRAAISSPLAIVAIANHCIDLYMQYTFPSAPLIHEPTLRNYASLFFADSSTTSPFAQPADEPQRIALLRAFALVTALCASVASVMPETLFSHGKALVAPFLHASREALRSFEDYDLECPTSASMTIRIFHSTALQHTTGRSGAAWHIHSQAALIAHKLRLYREQSVARVADPVESQLLRLHFWHIYASDQTAAVCQSRAFVLDESLFPGELSLQPHPPQGVALMDRNKPEYNEAFETRLLVGFHLFRCISCMAARIILRLRRHDSVPPDSEKQLLTQEYLEYTTLIDSLPPWLHISHLVASDGDDEIARLRKPSLWVQRCTILTVYHCLRLTILRQFIRSGMWDAAGLSDDSNLLAMKSIEMISGVLQTLEDIPLIYLQVKGEPTVERIRHIGSILLELLHTIDNETTKTRAQTHSRRLLDILVALNSKASDNLLEIGLST